METPTLFQQYQADFRLQNSHLQVFRGFRDAARFLLDRQRDPISVIPGREANVLYYALVFLVVAVIAGLLGVSGVASVATNIAYVLFVIAIVLFLVHLVSGRKVVP